MFKKKILPIVGVAAAYAGLSPLLAFADGPSLNPCPAGSFSNLCPNAADQTATGSLIRNIIVGILIIAAVIALLFLIWGGVKWIMSGGDKTKVQAARDTIIAAIIGLIIALLAYFILSVVLGLFGIHLTDLTLPSLTGL